MTLDPQHAKSIFLAALERPAEERGVFVEEACAGDAELRRRVDRLLEAHERPDSVPEAPAAPVLTEAPAPREGRESVSQPVGSAGGPGTVIGAYKLVQEVGEGGMGTVYLAQQTAPVKRLVALKVIRPGMDSRQVIARFEAERQALALMDHPNIAKVLDGGTTEIGRPYFVMELVKGLPITRYCDEHRLTPKQRLELFVPVCQAVQHAHQKGIIHRDLKPSNVLVAVYDGRPVPKVIDFGIAKATGQQLTEKTLVTGLGSVVGTLEYMSPEQAELNQLDIDTRSDIYSLGVLLYELLTGSTPLERKRLKQAAVLEVLRLIREEEPPRPSTRLSTTDELPSVAANRGLEPRKLSGLVRGELDWIVMRALEKDRNRRYDTANGLGLDIQRYLADEPVLACPPSAWYRFGKFARRNKAGLTVAGLVLFVMASLGGGIGWVVRDRAAREEGVANERREREAALDREVGRLLDEAGDRIDQGKWPEALGAVERADKLLVSAGRSERPPRLLALQKDLAVVRRLEDLYSQPGREDLFRGIFASSAASIRFISYVGGKAGDSRRAQESDAGFAKAFADEGIDVASLSVAEAGERIRARSIRQELARALDIWSNIRQRGRINPSARDPHTIEWDLGPNIPQRDKTQGAPDWKQLLEIAEAADPDPWRNPIRQARRREDRKALKELAASADVGRFPPETIVQLATALYQSGGEVQAMAMLRQAQLRYPEDWWISKLLGRWCHLSTPPRYDDAIRCYSACMALRPRDAYTLYEIGLMQYIGKKAYAPAVATFTRAIELDPDYQLTWSMRGQVYTDMQQWDKAAADCSRAIDLDPKDYVPLHFRGNAYRQLGQLEKALADYSKVIKLIPQNAHAWCNRGNVYGDMGEMDKALGDYSKALELDPKSAYVLTSRATFYGTHGQHDKALADLSRAIKLDPTHVNAWFNRGTLYTELGQLDKGITDLSNAIARDPARAQAWYGRGLAYSFLGEWDKAIADYTQAIAFKADFAEAHCNRGHVLRQQGEFGKALEDLRRGHELGSKNPRWPYPSAQWVRHCERLVELDKQLPGSPAGKTAPTSPAEQIELARQCSLKRLHRAAARYYEKALAADPSLYDASGISQRYHAARAAALAGCGQGVDADQLDDQERARLRFRALGWLRADLEGWGGLLASWPARGAVNITEVLPRWLVETDFAGVRGSEALARLPEAERQPWQKLWDDVAAMVNRARPIAAPGKKVDAK